MEDKTKKRMTTLTKVSIAFVIVLILSIGGLVYYYNGKVTALQQSISSLQTDLTNTKQTLGVTQSEVGALQRNLSLLDSEVERETTTLASNILNLEKNNNARFQTVDSMIEEIEQQTNVQLDELQSELASVQVSSGDFSAIVDDVVESVVSVLTDIGSGSGAYIDDRGFVITNLHVVDGASTIVVEFSDEKRFTANLIGYDDVVDVAVLQTIDGKEVLEFGDSDDVQVGQRVIAVGNPVGLSSTVTEGIVSAVKREGANDLPIYIQTDVPINPGNSGGPLISTSGEIIGINNFKLGGLESLGFALESKTAEDVADDIISKFLAQE